MSLRTRLFVEHLLTEGENINLNEEQSHYLSNVLRCKTHELLRVFNGKDGEWEATITGISKKHVIINLVKQLASQLNQAPLHFAFCPVKNVTPSFVVQKATELGVTEIWPITSRRTVINKINLEKLIKSAIEAAEQSERLCIPKIHPMQNLADFVKCKPFDGNLMFCYEKADPLGVQTLKSKLKQTENCILIGSEGGFSSEEADLIRSLDYAVAVNFGRRIMRAETAGIAAISCYNTLMDNWK